jgi:SsrA-binding protein
MTSVTTITTPATTRAAFSLTGFGNENTAFNCRKTDWKCGLLVLASSCERLDHMPDVATNRQASHRYHLLEKWEAGLVLTGTEVKSLREGKAQIKDGYAALRDGEVWLYNIHIPPYAPASRENHEPERPRKLLMHKREIERLIGKTREKGLTLVPTRLYFKGGRAKVEIALAKGKDVGDKRQAIKEREMKREMERAIRR